jgi:hypothetical protein
MSATKLSQLAATGGKGQNQNVHDAVHKYEQFHEGGWNESKSFSYMDMVNKYYDLSTSFYEFGWGESFHFAHRLTGETLRDSLKRHEHYLAAQGGFKKGDKVKVRPDHAPTGPLVWITSCTCMRCHLPAAGAPRASTCLQPSSTYGLELSSTAPRRCST